MPETQPASTPSNDEINEMLEVARLSARRHGASTHEAEEVSQQTTIKLLGRWDEPNIVRARARGSTGWRNFVAAVAKNVHLDLVRSQLRRIARERRAAGLPGERPVERPATHRPKPRDPSGVELYLARQAVIDTIAQLESERQRECMTLVYVEGLSIRETAAVLDVDPQTVRFHLRRAQSELQRLLGEEPDEDGESTAG